MQLMVPSGGHAHAFAVHATMPMESQPQVLQPCCHESPVLWPGAPWQLHWVNVQSQLPKVPAHLGPAVVPSAHMIVGVPGAGPEHALGALQLLAQPISVQKTLPSELQPQLLQPSVAGKLSPGL